MENWKQTKLNSTDFFYEISDIWIYCTATVKQNSKLEEAKLPFAALELISFAAIPGGLFQLRSNPFTYLSRHQIQKSQKST